MITSAIKSKKPCQRVCVCATGPPRQIFHPVSFNGIEGTGTASGSHISY